MPPLVGFGRYPGAPNVGKRLNVSRNNASAVDYDFELNGNTNPNGPFNRAHNGYGQGRSFSTMWSSWSGSVFCPWYGTKGGTVVMGGGHSGNQGYFCYIYDHGTELWVRIGAPRNVPATMSWAGFLNPPTNDYTAGSDLRNSTWRDYLYNGSYIKLLDHTYNTIVGVSPAEGGGIKGGLLIPQAPLTQDPSFSGGLWASHLFSLDDGTSQRAMTAPSNAGFNDNNATVAVKDTKRGVVWYFRQGSTTCWRHTLNASGPPFAFAEHQIQKISGGLTTTFIAAVAVAYEYCEEADAIVCIPSGSASLNAPVSIQVFDMSTGVPVDLQRAGLPEYWLYHGGYAPSFTWCPPQQAFYIYEGLGDTFCTVLRPSSLNFSNCTWAWSREDFSGDPTINGHTTTTTMTTLDASYRRFNYNPNTGCFNWHDGPLQSGNCLDGRNHDGVMQAWRPPGVVL